MENALISAQDPKGVGLAAPQIGVKYTIFIAKPTDKSKIQVFINPKKLAISNEQLATGNKKLRSHKSKQPKKLEGCLSLISIWGEVKRPENILLAYFDEKGIKHTKTFKGFMATIIQHELDHLEGILFPRRVLEQKGQLYKSHKSEKGEDVFDPIEV